MTPTLIIFMVLTALSVVPIAAGLRDRDNWAISDVRVFVRFWLPVQIILGLWPSTNFFYALKRRE